LIVFAVSVICGGFLLGGISESFAADRPQWGEAWSRNNISPEVGLPDWFDPGKVSSATGEVDLGTTANVRWVARLGTVTYATPIIAEGKVFQGTNNGNPRDPRVEGDRGILMCFDEKTGEFLWQLVVSKLYEYKWADWHLCGITSPPTVENGRAYLVSNRCEVLCLDIHGLADGNAGPFLDEGRHMSPPEDPPLEPTAKDADIIWLYDMPKELGVRPHNASNCSILIDGDLLYVCTSNGVEWTHSRVDNPEAPSIIVLEKHAGRLVAVDDFGIGPDIIHGQWSSPAMGEVGGKKMIFWGGGNGFVYGFEALKPDQLANAPKPLRIRPTWYFNGHPLAQTQDHIPYDHQEQSTSFEVVANPVFYNNRVYVAVTQDAFHNMLDGWLVCLDAAGGGNITRNGLVWNYRGTRACVSTVAIADGLLYVADHAGRLHCLDAESGSVYWVHDAGGPIWASPLVADGKIYLGTGRKALWVLRAGRSLEVLHQITMPDRILCTPAAAHGTLYVATQRHLYAVAQPAVLTGR